MRSHQRTLGVAALTGVSLCLGAAGAYGQTATFHHDSKAWAFE